MRPLPVALVLAVLLPGARALGEEFRNREEFSKSISQLKEGMSADEVRALLGDPDDVRTKADPGHLGGRSGTKEVWCYGTSGHLTTPTLGRIYLGEGDLVQSIDGGYGSPPPTALVGEAQLRQLIIRLDAARGPGGWSYDPGKVIQTVNLLQAAGEKIAVAAIGEYIRVTSSHQLGAEHLFPIIRLLYEVPDPPGYHRYPLLGRASHQPPEDERSVPLFPVFLQDEIPFFLNEGYSLEGMPESPLRHLAELQKAGRFRKAPLAPSVTPLRAAERALAANPWFARDGGELDSDQIRSSHLLNEQVMRLLDTVFRLEPDRYGTLLPWDAAERKAILDRAAVLKIRWDPVHSRYTLEDGTVLPAEPRPLYRKLRWNPELPQRRLELVMERETSTYVTIHLNETVDTPSAGTVRLFQRSDPATTVSSFPTHGEFTGQGTAGYHSFSRTLSLPEGRKIQFELIGDGIRKKSPVFVP